MNQKNQIVDPTPNGFWSVLQRKELNDGLLTTASETLSEAALAAYHSGKKATVTLTLTLEPKKGAVNIGAVVTSKIPSTKQDSLTIFYVDETGGLHRDDPRQREMELTAHDGGKAETAQPVEAASVAS